MDHSQAKRYAISMVAKHVARDLQDIPNTNFLVELEKDDRLKIEQCLRDIHESMIHAGLNQNDFSELGFIANWLKG